MTIIAKRVFAASDQNHFASLSGDFNPMHVDAIAARRTQAGAPVVHGVHAVLWALEMLLEEGRIAQPIASLDVRFQKFIYLESEVEVRVTRDTPTALRAELFSEGVATTTIDMAFGMPTGQAAAPLGSEVAHYDAPLNLDLSDLTGRAGLLRAPAPERIARVFPATASALGGDRMAGIASLSLLVGMVCPGMHSIFTSFAITFIGGSSQPTDLSFAVRVVDSRFRMVEIAVEGRGISGMVTAFLRQPPVPQPTLGELRNVVPGSRFVNCNALVVGASRGLGALTAKLIVAGGGRVTITYAAGEADAREIAYELGLDSSSVLHYDARTDAAPQLSQLNRNVSQLYYFATARIFRQKQGLYAPGLFAEFSRIYADGFADLCFALKTHTNADHLTVFYPSSIAVEERPRDLTEYAMAKIAGETLCADINKFMRNIHVLVKRLPRLFTDQTATVMPSHYADPLESILPIIEEMQGYN